MASKSSGHPPGDEATRGYACDEGEDEAGPAGGHGVHTGRGQLGETVDLWKKGKSNCLRDDSNEGCSINLTEKCDLYSCLEHYHL